MDAGEIGACRFKARAKYVIDGVLSARDMQLPSGALLLSCSGQGFPLVMRATTSSPMCDFPKPGSPAMSVSLRRAIRPKWSKERLPNVIRC
jgi:hypothetical protein